MPETGILTSHISKLGHPIQEIRERALSQLLAKLNYGFEFDDELARTRELLTVLFSWFKFERPRMQQDVLSLLFKIIKSEAGKYLVKELGTEEFKHNLGKIEHIVDSTCRDTYNSIMVTLNLFSTLQPDDADYIPVLNIPSSNDSRSDNGKQRNREYVGQRTSQEIDSNSSDNSNTCYFNKRDKPTTCLRVVLLPWLPLCSSDRKTLTLVEDALQILRSTRKYCWFLKDVLLRDFPPDVFFNRPVIIKKLQAMIGQQGQSSDVSEVLLALTISVDRRIDQLFDPAFKHSRLLISEQSSTVTAEALLEEDDIEKLAADLQRVTGSGETDVAHSTAKMLNQLPVPLYCLDTLYQLITAMDRSLTFLSIGDSEEILNIGDLNIALCLSQKLVLLLIKCVSNKIWQIEHNTKLLKDIVQKTFMVMRLAGDLLNKYRISTATVASASEIRRSAHFIAYVQLSEVLCVLASWSCSAYACMPPTPLGALQQALVHAPLAALQPHAHLRVQRTLQRLSITLNQDLCKKHKDVVKLCKSLEKSILLIKEPDKYVNSPQVISLIMESLPALELHSSLTYVRILTGIFTHNIQTWDMDDQMWEKVRKILVSLMAHQLDWVQEEIYKSVSEHVTKFLNVSSSGHLSGGNEKCLQFLFDSTVLLEICCHGLASENYCVQDQAKQIMMYLLRGKLMMSERCWYTLLSSLLPVMPILHAYAAHEDILGNAIMRSLERKVSECMLVPQTEIWAGLARLLYCRCPAAQMHGAHQICSALLTQEDASNLLPTPNAVHPDTLMTAIRKVKATNLNLDSKTVDTQCHQEMGLKQIMEVLTSNIKADNLEHSEEGVEAAGGAVQASFTRASLQQLAVMMQQSALHPAFLQQDGLQLMCQYLRLSMTVEDFKVFPECAKSCMSVLNSVSASSATARTDMAKVPDIVALLLRAIFVFPNDDAMVTITMQMLFLVLYSGYILQELEQDGSSVLSMPHCVLSRMNVPFPCRAYWKYSSHRRYSNVESLVSDEQCALFVRVRWAACWYDGIENVLRWASVPLHKEHGKGEGSVAPHLMLSEADLSALKAACSVQGSVAALYRAQNSTTHQGVEEAFNLLAGYCQLMVQSPWCSSVEEYYSLPWRATLSRFLVSSPASPKDVVLLSTVLQFARAHVRGCMQYQLPNSPVSWIMDTLSGDSESILSILKKSELYPKQTAQEQVDIMALRSNVVRLALCCSLAESRSGKQEQSRWEPIVLVLLQSLDHVDCQDFHTLGYFGEIVRFLRYLIHAPVTFSVNTVLLAATSILRCTTKCPQSQRHYHGCKGQAVLVDTYVTLAGLLQQMRHLELTAQNWSDVWWVESGCGLRLVVHCCSSAGVKLRAAALHLLAGLAATSHTVYLLNEALSDSEESIEKFATRSLLDPSEASLVREEACRLLANFVASQSTRGHESLHKEIGEHLESCCFVEVILSELTRYCSAKTPDSQLESNIPLEYLEEKEKYEVLSSKSSDWSPSAKLGDDSVVVSTPGLVAAMADLVHNLSFHHLDSLKLWNADGLFRMFFRCLCCNGESVQETLQLHGCVCRLLARALVCTDVHNTISQTKDCIAALISLLTPFHLELEKDSEQQLIWLHHHALQLTGELVARRAGLLSVWRALDEKKATRAFLHTLLQAIRSRDSDLNKAAFFCLNQLLNGFNKNSDLNESMDGVLHFLHDNVLIIPSDSNPSSNDFGCNSKSKNMSQTDLSQQSQSKTIVNVMRPDEPLAVDEEAQCEATCLSEEMVTVLMDKIKFYESQNDLKTRQQDEYYTLVASTLASLLSSSSRAREFAIHHALPYHLLLGLAQVRNYLTIDGKPVQILKNSNKNNPALENLTWILLLMTCLMTDCRPAKDCLAENSVAYSLTKLWPWCLSTPSLRAATIALLQRFTNDCPKAWGAMCSCAGQQCLLAEVCRLAGQGEGGTRAGQTRACAGSSLQCGCLQVLQNCSQHTHARALILKNDIMDTFNKLHPAISKPGTKLRAVEREWERLAETLSLYPDGQMRLLEYSSTLCALVTQARGCMLNVITNCAFNPNNRSKFLGSAELLQALMSTLNAGPQYLQQQVTVGGALWAIANNNHKAKLTLRSCGVATCVSECVARLRHAAAPQAEQQRALQLLTYLQRLLAS